MTQPTEWLQNNAAIIDAKTAHAFAFVYTRCPPAECRETLNSSQSTSTMWVAFGHRHRSKKPSQLRRSSELRNRIEFF